MSLFKKISRHWLLIVASIGVALFLMIVFGLKKPLKDTIRTNTENTELIDKQEEPSVGLPMRLKIPSIAINVSLEYVDVTESGTMDIPKNVNNVGWFQPGKLPGEIGNAVMAGHYGSYAGKPSVFDNLHKLTKGDKIYVEDNNGETITFVVQEIRSYDPQADASEVFSSDDEKSHLNLITCEGIWNKDAKSYSSRLVVFTDKE